jgi:tape measure domain-containing protein
MSETKLTIDGAQVLNLFDAIEGRVLDLERILKDFPTATRTAFGTATLGKFDAQAGDLAALLQRIDRQLSELPQATKDAFQTADLKKYASALQGVDKATDALDRAEKKARQVNKTATAGTSIFGGLLKAAAAATAGLSFSAAIVEGVRLNIQYEQISQSLTVLLKDAGKANRLLAEISEFAAETPFETDQIASAAKSLIAFGESEDTVIDKLRQIGTVSAATGKDFNELTNIYGKAKVAGVLYAEEINQLIEAGVPIIQEFSKQLGVPPSQVKKLASEGKIGFSQLETAFKNLTTEGGRFAGLLEAQGKTLGGRLSTLADNAKQLLRGALSTQNGIIGQFVDNLSGAAKQLAKLFDVPLSSKIRDEQFAFAGLANQIRLTAVGTERRSQLIERLRQQYPEFLKGINAEKVTNEQLEPILKKINDRYVVRVALQQQVEKVKEAGDRAAGALGREIEAQDKVNRLLAEGAAATGVNLDNLTSIEAQVRAVASALDQKSRGESAFAQMFGLNESARFKKDLIANFQVLQSLSNVRGITENETTDALKAQERQVEILRQKYGQLVDDVSAENKPTAPAGTTDFVATGDGKKKKTAAEIAFEKREADLAKRGLLLNDLEDGLFKELAAVNLHFDQLALEYEKAGTDTANLEKRRQDALLSTTREHYKELEQAQAEHVERERAKTKEAAEASLAAAESRLDLEAAEFEAKLQIDRAILDQIVADEQKKEKLKERLAREEQVFDLNLQAKRLELRLQFGQDLTEVDRKVIAQQIANLRAEAKAIGAQDAKTDKETTSIWSLLGLDPENDKDASVIEGIKTAASEITAVFQAAAEANVAAAEAKKQAADEAVQAAQTALDTEIDLAKEGFASDVDLARQRLEKAKQQQAEALEQQKQAQRQQIALETAVQAVSLITSSANIFKSLSPGFPYTLPVAIAAVALMFGAFAKAKSDALRATKYRSGGEGHIDRFGRIVGPSHENGGVRPVEFEGGEFFLSDGQRFGVANRNATAKHFDLLKAVNEDNRAAILSEALSLYDFQFPKARPTLPGGAGATNAVVGGTNTAKMESLLSSILGALEDGERWSPDGRTRRRGNTTVRFMN